MQCPRCRSAMVDFRTDGGVTLDLCPGCQDLWFDRGELAAVLGTAEDLPALDGAAAPEPTGIDCARCGAPLVTMRYAPDAPLTVQTCPVCQGTLCPMDRLAPLHALAARYPRQASFGVVRRAESDASLARAARRFGEYRRLAVRQRKHWGEILLGYEARNEYAVIGNDLGAAFHVEEQAAGFPELLRRLLLGPLRPFLAYVEDVRRGDLALRLRRPFRWYLHRLEVLDHDEARIGAIQRRWSWVGRDYAVEDGQGRALAVVSGAFWRPWTFEIRVGDAVVGMIRKRWSGLLKEAFTDADNYEIEFTAATDARVKPLALAAAILIDVVHFERSKR